MNERSKDEINPMLILAYKISKAVNYQLIYLEA
jgi:hypothetical protein